MRNNWDKNDHGDNENDEHRRRMTKTTITIAGMLMMSMSGRFPKLPRWNAAKSTSGEESTSSQK